MKCKFCGKEFTPRGARVILCSADCSRLYYSQKNLEWEQEKVVRKCPVCGDDFQVKVPYQKFCSSECRAKSYKKEFATLRTKKINPAETKPKRKSLSEWEREASECNLDYGTYRALIEGGKTFEEIKAQNHVFRAHSHVLKKNARRL